MSRLVSTFSPSSKLSCCCTTPIRSRIFRPSVRRSWPKIVARPEVGCNRVVSILIVVVLPAPFGPRKPKTSDRSISNETRSTATLSPKRFESSWTRMTGSCVPMSHMPIFAAATLRRRRVRWPSGPRNMKLCGSPPSAVLVVGLLQPPQHFRINARTCGEFNLDGHGFVNPRRPQTSAGLPPCEPEPEINPVFRGWLDPGEGPPRRDERDESLACLNRDLAKPHRRVDESVEDGPELRSIRILTVDELIRRREEKVRISESLHHQEGLCVAGHALLCEPGPKFVLVVESFPFDASIPLVDPFACAFLEEANRHVLHSLPITRLRHRHNPFKRLRRLSNPTEKVSEDSREPLKSSGCRQDPFEISLLSRRAVSRGGLRVFLLDLGEKGFGEPYEVGFAHFDLLGWFELQHGLVRRELDPRAGRVRPSWELVDLLLALVVQD